MRQVVYLPALTVMTPALIARLADAVNGSEGSGPTPWRR